MARSTWVIGVGMSPFYTPRNAPTYIELGSSAIREALTDAGVCYGDVEQIFAGYVYGDSCSGHRVAYEVGLSGVPVFNVSSNCSSGSSALFLARQAVENGVELALAVGFEQMGAGALVEHWTDRPSPLERFTQIAERWLDGDSGPLAPKLFAAAAREYCERYGVEPEGFGAIAVKSRRHAATNPKAVFRDPLSLEQVLASPVVCDPLTRFQCCPPTSGAAAVLIASESFARRLGGARPVRIAGQALVTDLPCSFGGSAVDAAGFQIAHEAALRAFDEAGIDANDIHVAEIHDCFTVNEVLAYEALGLCPPGGAFEFIASGANTYGGSCVTNPSGGLLSKGHPLGATGLAQCFELVTQLRGEAKARQVPHAQVAVAHNIGIGSSCVVTVFKSGRAGAAEKRTPA